MVITLLVSLYCSRIILAELGVVDFGIFNLVGGIVALFSFITQSMSSSFQRFFCVNIDDNLMVTKIFSNSMIFLFVLSSIIFIFSFLFGGWFVETQLNIPIDRVPIAKNVLYISVFTLVVNLYQSIFNSVLISYEKMVAFASLNIFQSLLKLFLVLSLEYVVGDKLIIYSLYVLLISLIVLVLFIVYCHKKFKFLWQKISFDKEIAKNLFSFSGMTVMGTLSNVSRNQFVNIFLNIFWGTVINAARGISYQVYTACTSFVRSFQVAFSPVLTKLYARNELDRLNRQVFFYSKLSYFIVLIVSFPVLLYTGEIVRLWLGDTIPMYTEDFVKIILFTSLLESISNPLIVVIYATGKIKQLQVFSICWSFIIIMLSYLLLYLNYSPVYVVALGLIYELIGFLIRLVLLSKLISFSVISFVKNVVLYLFNVSVCIITFAFVLKYFFFVDSQNIFIQIFLSLLATIFVVIFLGFNNKERDSLLKLLINKI